MVLLMHDEHVITTDSMDITKRLNPKTVFCPCFKMTMPEMSVVRKAVEIVSTEEHVDNSRTSITAMAAETTLLIFLIFPDSQSEEVTNIRAVSPQMIPVI